MTLSFGNAPALPAVMLVGWIGACGGEDATQKDSGTQSTSGSATTDGTSTTSMTSGSSTMSNTSSGASSSESTNTTNDTSSSSTSTSSGGSASVTTNTSGGSTGGAGGVGTVDGAGGTAGTGSNAAADCASGNYLICEDFESTEVGGVPDDWTQHGEEARVADDEAHGGAQSLKLGAIPNWERRIYHDASLLGGAHWGRIYYKVELPVPDAFVHSTLVALSGVGPTFGESEYRVVDTVKQSAQDGSMHQFLYNVQPQNAGEFATGGPYDFSFDAEWHCAEYFIDGPNQAYALYVDGEEELAFENGAGNYQDSDMPDSFVELRVGWINYQDAPPGFTAWIDDIAFDETRVGCLP